MRAGLEYKFDWVLEGVGRWLVESSIFRNDFKRVCFVFLAGLSILDVGFESLLFSV